MLLLRFQNPAFVPFMTNANVHRESPRRVFGRQTAAVSNDANDKTNVILIYSEIESTMERSPTFQQK